MTKPHIVLVHGMGDHEEDSFKNTFITPLNKAAQHFSSLGHFNEDMVNISYIDYNHIFEKVRTKIKETAIENLDTLFPNAPSLVVKLTDFHSKFGDDSFFYTHWLDVLLYRSFYADAVQTTIGLQLVKAMQNATNEAADLHIVCHSLGTAATTDTLHKLYINSLHNETGDPLLSAGLNRIRSISMIANVSQLPITETNPYTSVVKPGPNGICDYFMSCRHVLDPIASLVKFEPGAHWPLVTDSSFRNIVINGVERANVHDLDHYLADPNVYLPFFMQLFPLTFTTNKQELEAAYTAHAQTTVQGRFEQLKSQLEDSDITLHWDSEKNEFVFFTDEMNLNQKIIEFRDHLKAIESQINSLQGD